MSVTQIGNLASFFKRNPRNTWSLTDTAPEWLRDAVHEAHAGALPNDWVYEECKAACDALDDEAELDDDAIHEWADSRVDIYNAALRGWFADQAGTDFFSNAEEEANEICSDDAADIMDRIRAVQYCAIRAIWSVIVSAYTANVEDDG